jgi:hypothetical protein
MTLLLMAALQAVSSGPTDKVDLTIHQPCQQQSVASDEVVVCAGSGGQSPYRLEQQPGQRKNDPKAQLQVAEGVAAAVETESADVGGFPSNRAMVRLKIKF